MDRSLGPHSDCSSNHKVPHNVYDDSIRMINFNVSELGQGLLDWGHSIFQLLLDVRNGYWIEII